MLKPLLSDALTRAKAANPNDPRLAGMMSNLALTYSHLGRLDQAESLFEQAIDLLKKQPDKTAVRARIEDNLGVLYMREHKLEQGGKHLIAARELFKKVGALSSPPAAMNLDNLSKYYRAIGKLPEAVSMCQEALALMQKQMGPDNPDVAIALLNLADLQSAQNNYSESEKLYKQGIGIIEHALGDDHPMLVQALQNYAQMLETTNRKSEAAKLLSRAKAIGKAVGSNNHAAPNEANPERQAMNEPAGPVQDIKTETDFNNWSTYYYLYPRPDLTVKALLFAEQSGYFNKNDVRVILIALTSQIFRQNPKQLPAWIKELAPMKTEHKQLIWKALWQANTAESQNAANLLAQNFPTYGRPPVLSQSSPSPQPIEKMELSPPVLDMLWASFFITGDERYVERIMAALPGQGQHDANKMITAGAASWSLAANAHQHKRVMNICLAALQKHPEWKPELNEVIGRANAPQK